MGKVVSVSNLKFVKGKKVVVGGCFDSLHPGHLTFLEKAKREGDVLIVLLESDQRIKEKGRDPYHTQKDRAQSLSLLSFVDYIILLPAQISDQFYDDLVKKIHPQVIATTLGYPNTHHQRVAKLVGAKVKVVTKKIGQYSSSKILKD